MRTVRVLLAFAFAAALLAGCGLGDDDDPVATRPPAATEVAAGDPTPGVATPETATPGAGLDPGFGAVDGFVPAARGDAARTGRQPGPGPDGSPVTRWAIEIDAPVRAAPVLADGVLLVASEGEDGALIAFDAASGEEIWRADGSVGASPAVADGRVFVGADGSFDALDLRTGEELWSFRTQTGRWTSPVVADGTVYVGDLDNRLLYALEAATGRQQWTPLRGFNRAPASAGGVVVAASPDGLFALDAATGATRWLVYTDTVGYPAVLGDAVYVVAQALGTPIRYLLVALDGEGQERWRVDLGAVEATSPALSMDDGTVFVAATERGRPAALIAFDAATGARRFAVDIGSVAVADPVVAGGLVYLAGQDGKVAAFDGETGEPVWSFAPVSGTLTDPVVAGGLVFVGNAGPSDGLVLAIGGVPGAATPAAGTPDATPLAVSLVGRRPTVEFFRPREPIGAYLA